MANEFKFRVLTREDWMDLEPEHLTADGLLKLGVVKTYTSRPLDSGIENCRWHRIILDADIPENSLIKVSFHTAQSEQAEIKWTEPLEFQNKKDALVEAPPGRYIKLNIEGEGSPIIRQIKIYFPRLSYLRYLPSIYQEDSAGKEFLERFLSMFESFLHDNEELISLIPSYFDPMAAPENFIPWLADWVSLDLYELLGDKNREFILKVLEFYKQKGMAEGISRLVSLLTGIEKCCVKEYMNNVFRTYGMEHSGENVTEGNANRGCSKLTRQISKIVDTNNKALLEKIGTYHDEVHYVTDTSETGRYSRNAIGLFLFLSLGEEFTIDEDELRKIIKTFLPVFVRAEINVVESSWYPEIYELITVNEVCISHIHGISEDEFKDIKGRYKDHLNGWEWLRSFDTSDKEIVYGKTNDLKYGTPHDKLDREMIL